MFVKVVAFLKSGDLLNCVGHSVHMSLIVCVMFLVEVLVFYVWRIVSCLSSGG